MFDDDELQGRASKPLDVNAKNSRYMGKWLPPGYDTSKHPSEYFVPNFFSRRERIINILWALFLMLYAVFSIVIDDFFVPGRFSDGIHLSAYPAWVMFLASCCGAAVLISVVVDHYDKQNNEQKYKRFRRVGTCVGAGLYLAALVLHVFLSV